MAVPRATQFIALRSLSRGAYQVRNLHMTGPATYASPALTKDLPADEPPPSGAFTTAINDSAKRPTTTKPSQPTVRHFNTSRTLKAVGDSSYIDFAYLPQSTLNTPTEEIFRVPILPNNYRDPAPHHEAEIESAPVMKAEISTMSADAVFLPMSELSDGHAMNIDFHAMADRVAANFKRMAKVPEEEQAGLMKQIWGDIVDDMLGKSKKAAV